MWNPNPRFVALATARLGAVGVATAGIVSSRTPETPSGDGVAAGLGGILVVCAVAGAGLLCLVERTATPNEWPRRLLTAGAAAGGAVVRLVGQHALTTPWALTGSTLVFRVDGVGMGPALVPVGVACSGIKAVLQVVDTVRARDPGGTPSVEGRWKTRPCRAGRKTKSSVQGAAARRYRPTATVTASS
ncbi:hypothetical protein BRD03_11610 [Halobacteriales archaeon QS_9_68_17]|nr:MAG: hypothetical protein BRD03_11610 [Halobacteriales archaeon QS_9_68_17]